MEEKITKLATVFGLLLGCSKSYYKLFASSTNNPAKMISGDKVESEKFGKTTLFEITIYCLFRLDLSLVKLEQQDDVREELFLFCVENTVKKFEKELKNNNLREIIDNRLNGYGAIIRNSNKDKFQEFFFHLLQLIYKSQNSNKVDFRNFEGETVILADAFQEFSLKANLFEGERNIVSCFGCCLKHLFQDNDNFMLLTLQEIEERINDGIREAKEILKNDESQNSSN
ncbi:MAG: hypothetical protein WC283_01055 [Candidatus Paceibacterota bacterium]